MATARMTIEGYGQIEINNCAFRRDGRIEAQCAPNATDFASAVVENGMLLAVDKLAGTVGFVKSNNTLPVALVYSAEHIYDERTPGLKNFKLEGTGDFLPRLGYLSVGDTFTTNCVSYDTSAYATEALFITALEGIGTTPLYGKANTDGSILVTATASGASLKVVKYYTMPDGSKGIKFQAIA